MRTSFQSALTISLAAALLAGCGGSQLKIGAPSVMPQALAIAPGTTSTNYKVVYSFGNPPDGSYPTASLIDMGGTLYGTTAGGGSNSCAYYPYSPYFGCGTVFSITPSGTEKVLYNFGSAPDGSVPYGNLRDVGGTLYGTTVYGGSYTCGYRSQPFSCGTVFTITTSGTERVLHNFGQEGDGRYPLSGLIKVQGTLYGTTSGGGANYCAPYQYNIHCGTVFSITPGGTEDVLHSFGPARRRANTPLDSLIDVGGKLYGTTKRGGRHGFGAIFSITLRGGLKVVHYFGGTDGSAPVAGLIEVTGTLYGTTSAGGANGDGTVFSITPDGTEKVLHSFGALDGADPTAGLTTVKSTLYGTTRGGGAHGGGTIFSITTSGRERVLHSFGGSGSDGRSPYGRLTGVRGTLYGTTEFGGTYGDGTVFALTP